MVSVDNPSILHLMNSVFGRPDQYGGRSWWIAASDERDRPVDVFYRSGPGYQAGVVRNATPVALPPAYQIPRYGFSLLGWKAPHRKTIGAGFDRAMLRSVRRSLGHGQKDRAPILVHAWDWMPRTLSWIRSTYPDTPIVRDVVVNRRLDFFYGSPVADQAAVVDAFFSPSTYTTEQLVSWGVPRRQVFEIPFGVDTDVYRPRQDQNHRDGEPLRFAFSGAVSRRKGVDSLLRAWRRLALPNAELHLYGKVRDVSRELRAAPANVVVHGHVSLPEELPKNNVYVFPSTLEGSAKSVYEALACGLPVITTPQAGSLVRDDQEGLLVPAGDDDALAGAIHTLFHDPDRRRRYGVAARRRAENHTWAHYGERVWAAYGDLIAGK